MKTELNYREIEQRTNDVCERIQTLVKYIHQNIKSTKELLTMEEIVNIGRFVKIDETIEKIRQENVNFYDEIRDLLIEIKNSVEASINPDDN